MTHRESKALLAVRVYHKPNLAGKHAGSESSLSFNAEAGGDCLISLVGA